MKTAKFEKRIFSYLVDLVPCVAIGIVLFIFVFNKIPVIQDLTIYTITFVISSIMYILIWTLILKITNGYTLGGAIFRIKTVSMYSERLSIKECFLKNIFLGFFPCVIVNAFYMLIVHTDKTIFDQLSNTISISSRQEF